MSLLEVLEAVYDSLADGVCRQPALGILSTHAPSPPALTSRKSPALSPPASDNSGLHGLLKSYAALGARQARRRTRALRARQKRAQAWEEIQREWEQEIAAWREDVEACRRQIRQGRLGRARSLGKVGERFEVDVLNEALAEIEEEEIRRLYVGM